MRNRRERHSRAAVGEREGEGDAFFFTHPRAAIGFAVYTPVEVSGRVHYTPLLPTFSVSIPRFLSSVIRVLTHLLVSFFFLR